MTVKKKLNLDQAISLLKRGGVVAYPTEAVYGLGCDPANISAVKKILQIKQRDKAKGLIVVASDYGQLKSYLLPLDSRTEQKLLASWPGPVTWLVPARESVSSYLKGQYDTLAVRVSNHPVVKQLCDEFGPIISTSANIAGEEAARTAEQVKDIFNSQVDYIIEGETDKSALPSEIRDALTDKIIRSA